MEHVANNSFTVGARYDEQAVNDKLRVWCEGGEVDHVTLRRYLIDARILVRANGIYARPAEDGAGAVGNPDRPTATAEAP